MPGEIRNVALLGGQGRLGAWILAALQKSERNFNVTILQRVDSKTVYNKAKYPKLTIRQLPQGYTEDHAGCVAALHGQDALVIAIPGGKVHEQKALATACVEAGVRRMIPADYGSLDSDDPVVLDLVPIFARKKEVREYLEELTRKNPSSPFSWTSIVCGHFFDYALESPRMLQYDLVRRQASIFDTGDERWSATTRTRVGEAVAKILESATATAEMPRSSASLSQSNTTATAPIGRHDITRNCVIYIHSFSVSQNDILTALVRASGAGVGAEAGGGGWEVRHGDGEKWIRDKYEETQAAKAAGGESEKFWLATEEMVGVLGMRRANWETKSGFVNREFGFVDEDLDTAVNESWKRAQSKKE